jgi:hypothetical protein
MAEQPKKASLSDVLNYVPEQYLSADELSWIRSTFKDNPKAINTLRKLFLPTISDATLPVEQMGDDAFSSGLDFMSMPAEHAKVIAAARQDAIKFIFGGIIKTKIIAQSEDESPMESALRRSKDSTK